MNAAPRVAETRRKVYEHLAEGKSQVWTAGRLEIDPRRVSEHADALEVQGYLTRIKGTKSPIIYEKGPNGPRLDAAILTAVSGIHARGVTPSACPGQVKTALVHHLKFRCEVLRAGDYQILDKAPYLDHNNVKRYKGRMKFPGGWESNLEYEVTPNMETFYTFCPALDMTAQNLEQYEKLALVKGRAMYDHLSKTAGWRFGTTELCIGWERHIAVESAAVKGIAGRFTMKSDSGNAWLSNSDGRAELEFHNIKQAKTYLEMPEAVERLELDMAALSGRSEDCG